VLFEFSAKRFQHFWIMSTHTQTQTKTSLERAEKSPFPSSPQKARIASSCSSHPQTTPSTPNIPTAKTPQIGAKLLNYSKHCTQKFGFVRGAFQSKLLTNLQRTTLQHQSESQSESQTLSQSESQSKSLVFQHFHSTSII